MALPASGAISMSQVNTEIGASSTAQISLNDSAVRSLFGKASGAIAMSDGYGKSNAFAFTISSNTQNANLRTLALAAGWNGSSSVTATVASGVYLWSDSTSTAGLIIDGSWPGGVALINNGFIMGKGGNAATGNAKGVYSPAQAGGPAISLGVSVAITSSSGYIGGGGGGAGMYQSTNLDSAGGGGGAGGGRGGTAYYKNLFGSGGAGGAIGQSGANGIASNGGNLENGKGGGAGGGGGALIAGGASGGGGGGRIMPGVGGAGGNTNYSTPTYGGAGGSAGSAGNPGVGTAHGGGGGWGATGGNSYSQTTGPQVGGQAVALNGYAVTWTGGFPSGRVYGAVS